MMYFFPGQRMLSGIVKVHENVLVLCISINDCFCIIEIISHYSSSNYEAK